MYIIFVTGEDDIARFDSRRYRTAGVHIYNLSFAVGQILPETDYFWGKICEGDRIFPFFLRSLFNSWSEVHKEFLSLLRFCIREQERGRKPCVPCSSVVPHTPREFQVVKTWGKRHYAMAEKVHWFVSVRADK